MKSLLTITVLASILSGCSHRVEQAGAIADVAQAPSAVDVHWAQDDLALVLVEYDGMRHQVRVDGPGKAIREVIPLANRQILVICHMNPSASYAWRINLADDSVVDEYPGSLFAINSTSDRVARNVPPPHFAEREVEDNLQRIFIDGEEIAALDVGEINRLEWIDDASIELADESTTYKVAVTAHRERGEAAPPR